MFTCISGISVLITISASIVIYELKVQNELKKYKDKDWRYDG